jgi:hypothetical protein
MNAFYGHHKSRIEFTYRGFDRILLNGLIQPFQPKKDDRSTGLASEPRLGRLLQQRASRKRQN